MKYNRSIPSGMRSTSQSIANQISNATRNMTSSIVPSNFNLVIPELQGSKIRRTDDGRFSVYDLIRIAGGRKKPHDTWKRMTDAHSELLGKCESEELGTGKAKKSTPVATSENCLYILGLLSGMCGQSYREAAANIVRRYIEGDAELVLEKFLTAIKK